MHDYLVSGVGDVTIFLLHGGYRSKDYCVTKLQPLFAPTIG
jgi:hypothetical protein